MLSLQWDDKERAPKVVDTQIIDETLGQVKTA